MNHQGRFQLAAPRQQVWDKLNNLAVLQHCIPGCESLEANSTEHFSALIRARLGPINAKFQSQIQLSDIDEPQSYTLTVKSKGGAAGMGEGIARVKLQTNENGTQLDYEVELKVQGKLAQIGSRLINNAIQKLSNEFFQAFAGQVNAHGE